MTVTIQGHDCVTGADVSRWQGDIDWGRFPDSFAFIKATGGDGGLYVDGKFARNAAQCPAPWGPYHFASAAAFNAVAEANHFCDVILGSPWALLPSTRKLPPVLDWEPTRNVQGSGAWVLAFLHQVELRTGMRPIIYTGAYVSLDRVPELRQFPLWLAAYTPDPISCAPWGYEWTIWQWSSTTSVPGIVGNVDRNYARADWFIAATTGGAPTPSTSADAGTIRGADVQVINAIETKQGHYIYDPGPGTARVITPEESTYLQAHGWTVETSPAGGPVHVILNEKVTKLNYAEVA